MPALHCSWGDQSDDVFVALEGDFMKPRIQEVDQLLKLGVNVTIYNGQVYTTSSDLTDETDDWHWHDKPPKEHLTPYCSALTEQCPRVLEQIDAPCLDRCNNILLLLAIGTR